MPVAYTPNNRIVTAWKEKTTVRYADRSREEGSGVTTLQIGSYSGLDSRPYGIPSSNHIEDRPVYLVNYR